MKLWITPLNRFIGFKTILLTSTYPSQPSFKTETQKYKFYYASNNTKLLDEPKLIQNQDSLNNLLNFLYAKDFLTHLRNQRPNTKWVLERIVNLEIRIFPTTYPPENLENFRATLKITDTSLLWKKDENASQNVQGPSLLFPLFGYWKFGKTYHNCNQKAKELLNQYCEHFQVTPNEFQGIELDDFYALENFYEVQLFAMNL